MLEFCILFVMSVLKNFGLAGNFDVFILKMCRVSLFVDTTVKNHNFEKEKKLHFFNVQTIDFLPVFTVSIVTNKHGSEKLYQFFIARFLNDGDHFIVVELFKQIITMKIYCIFACANHFANNFSRIP